MPIIPIKRFRSSFLLLTYKRGLIKQHFCFSEVKGPKEIYELERRSKDRDQEVLGREKTLEKGPNLRVGTRLTPSPLRQGSSEPSSVTLGGWGFRKLVISACGSRSRL